MKTINFFILSLVLIITLNACKDTDISPESSEDIAIINNVSENVIFATYSNLDDKAGLLITSIQSFKASATEANLELCKTAWRNARIPWEQSEGFLFGPVDNAGIDPSIDSWPVNKIDLENVLNSNAILTKTYIDGLEGTLKGFHTIEFLLWGTGTKKVTMFNSRQFEYLIAVSESFKGATAQLKNEWSVSGKNFISELKNAGKTSKLYPSTKAVFEEFVEGITVIADEVANGKIQDPLALQDLKLEESQFSSNSKADFTDNIKSIQNVYLGTFDNKGTGKGLSNVIVAKNVALDTRFKQEITDAIIAIQTINGTFSTAIFTSKPSVENAQKKVRKILQTLEEDIKPLIEKIQ